MLLTPLEKEILIVLFEKKQITREFLLEEILKIKKDIETKTIESHLTRIRRKLLKIESEIQISSKEDVFFLEN
jgi:DNA-binding response OmpR family regulator